MTKSKRGEARLPAPPSDARAERAAPSPRTGAHASRAASAQEPREARAERVHGLRACLAVIATRPRDVRRVAFAALHRDEVEAAASRAGLDRQVPLEVRPDAELARLAESDLHEGVVLEASPRAWATPAALALALRETQGVAIALDRVRNPYNVGAILRSAAFLGADAAVLGAQAPHPALAPLAVRVAEGGAEQLRVARTTDLADTLARLRAGGARVFGADQAATRSFHEAPLPRPLVLVLGNEREGLSPRVRAVCEGLIAIPGSGRVESLNVSIAASLLLAEALRPPATGALPRDRR